MATTTTRWFSRGEPREPQYPRITFDHSWMPEIVVGCIRCCKTWPILFVPGADPDEVLAYAKDLDFGPDGVNLHHGVFVRCPLNHYTCALCSGAIGADGILSTDVYGPEKDRLGFDKTLVRWCHGSAKGPNWERKCSPQCIAVALANLHSYATVYDKIKAMVSTATKPLAPAGYSSNQGALYYANRNIQVVRVRCERDAHRTFAQALLCDGVPNCFEPLSLASVFGGMFSHCQQASIYKMWREDPRRYERAAFAAFFHMPPQLGRTGSGFCDYQGTPVPALRRLTNAYGLTPIRHRLVAYLAPGPKARDVRRRIPLMIPDHYKTAPEYYVDEEPILADAPCEARNAKRTKYF